MRKRDFVAGATCAVSTFGLILALSSPPRLDAIEPVALPLPAIASPEMEADGVVYSVLVDGRPNSPEQPVVQPDYKATLALVIKNTTDKPVEVRPTVRLESRSVADRLSRVPTLPSELWKQDQPALIAAGETKTITLNPDVQLKPASTVSAKLTVGERSIIAGGFSVSGPDQLKIAGR